MLKEIDCDLVQVRETGLGMILRVVILQANGWAEDFKFLVHKYAPNEIPIDNADIDCPNWTGRWLIAQTFTAMALEAFYYDYVIEKESKTKAENKCSPVVRYQYLAATYLGQINVTDSDLYIQLKALNTLRRHWVHNKSTDLGKYSCPDKYFSPCHCLALLTSVFRLFESNDHSCIVARVYREILEQAQSNVKDIIETI
ncbi:MAG: hypothetical protein KJ856_19285 [Gammaproteobacteria bacterium]|nr:hypothetical protein [Gammaproteobacteria bacterium]MBU1475856.1 hypothetical protein [Gammaproteobacteria bacterium]MBU1999645.1 hypothetical protein [Gammaproteobacteria bacterium]MBU2130882.1 hypothetical protein [Gammaproteobacteria bacterium]MBU2189130.1 hypothetical protein [Gammaproteobacteria bacterium]